MPLLLGCTQQFLHEACKGGDLTQPELLRCARPHVLLLLMLLTQNEWRGLGVQQSRGWEHYAIHRPEPHIMLFRCVMGSLL